MAAIVISTLQKLLGHHDFSTTMICTHLLNAAAGGRKMTGRFVFRG